MAGNVWAQKYAVVDSEKILEALPEYTVAQEQISKLQEQYTQKLQKEYDLLEHMFQKIPKRQKHAELSTKKDQRTADY